MIKSQLRTGHVLADDLLGAIDAVDRAAFLPEAMRGIAYIDDDLSLGQGRAMLEPLVFARMLQAARLKPEALVLTLADGAGYGAAVMARLVRRVVAIESVPELHEAAQRNLKEYGNALCLRRDVREGYASEAPYDAIFIEGGIEFLPQTLVDQLCEGGVLVAVEHLRDARTGAYGAGRLVAFHKERGSVSRRAQHDANVPLLPEFKASAAFRL
jgi:protein-L-isoaspartate(D-aspartate) O-methyltransferase